MNGADVIAEILKREGTEFLACYPRNPLIEACAAIAIRPILCRQERVGVGMADGFSRIRRGRQNGVFAAQNRADVDRGACLDQRVARITGEKAGPFALEDLGNHVGAVHGHGSSPLEIGTRRKAKPGFRLGAIRVTLAAAGRASS